MSGYTVDPEALIGRASLGSMVGSAAGNWSAQAPGIRQVAHLDPGAAAAGERFGEACDAGLAAVAALAATVDRLLVSAGGRYAGTEAEVRRAGGGLAG